ncbi:DUF1361 domain-containing protein [Chroococcidiopsis sp. CCALA 051]|uniref:DUF1361 domain-containing protein n=1 Tax=Chroococcidiopsis sp. CCALA 051 TaxID=869949 RepID=UPI000D0CFA96|nr:DUF1361 domain-containing protein [Chroococcidiopsis sp. CCALA 051]PSM49929.1 DUF1361 domain-containing protein [Chroococcidiopsis sp. CCALA 051]
MPADLSTVMTDVWHVLTKNNRWMSWNLFLAFVPLTLSAWLFLRGSQKRRWLFWLLFLNLLTFLPSARHVLTNILRFSTSIVTSELIWVVPLVCIPLYLLFISSGREHWQTFNWSILFLVFFAFLPNAPYVLTDIIHLYRDIRDIHSVWLITLVLIPVYVLFMGAGFEAYVLSLINLGSYLQRIGKSTWILGAELITHALCAVGVYLGRFLRFNSWDFITQPDTLVTAVVEDLFGKRPVVIMIVTFAVITGLYWLMKQVTLRVMGKSDLEAISAGEEGKIDLL